MSGGYEFVIFHCYDHGEFRVRKKSGEIGLYEPCPKCKKGCVRALPLALDLEFTNRCGGACITCPRGQDDFSRKIGDMSQQTFMPLFKEFRDWNTKQPNTIRECFLHMMGESIAHPRFIEWVNKLAKPTEKGGAGIGTLIVSTNGMPLNEGLARKILESRLHRLIISLDGTRKETVEKIRRGVKFEIVQKNVDTFLKLARQRSALGRQIPSIWVQMLKLNENEGEWLGFARKYTQNPRIRTVSPKGRQRRDIPGLPGGKVFLKTVERMGFMDELKEHKGWDGADRRRFTCDKVWKRASIWWDGRIPSPACCYTADSKEILGDIGGGRDSLHGVWLSNKFQKVREEFAKYQRSKGKEGVLPELCRDC